MAAIEIFKNERFGEIRVAGTSEKPLFCLVDVCKVLELDSSQVMKRLDDGVVTIHPITDSLGREREANFVNEDGLYDVILDSRKPQAKSFRKWITSEVLPSIRKTGSYSAQQQNIEEPKIDMSSSNFKVIPNYSKYAVDIYGNIYSLNYNKTGKIKIMKQNKNRYGYMQVQLYNDNKKPKLLSVHRIVAISFIPFVEGKIYINHIDGNKSNNYVSNLKWCNLSENTKHSYDEIKTQSYQRLSEIGKKAAINLRKFTKEQINDIRHKHNIKHISFRKLAKEYNCGKTVIERIVNNITYAY